MNSGFLYYFSMKWMIASDIHGSYFYCQKLLEKFSEEKADRILLLGDILYHGARNDLPKEYSPRNVAAALNKLSEKIICVKGNCDSEVDQMVLDFPLMTEYAILDIGDRTIFATHGHIFNDENPLKMPEGSILLCGHFHVPKIIRHKNYLYLNTGSVSLPKENSWHSYMLFDGDRFCWKDLESNEEKLNICLSSEY